MKKRAVMKSSVAKHYGCKPMRHCGQIGNRQQSSQSRFFLCKQIIQYELLESPPCTCMWQNLPHGAVWHAIKLGKTSESHWKSNQAWKNWKGLIVERFKDGVFDCEKQCVRLPYTHDALIQIDQTFDRTTGKSCLYLPQFHHAHSQAVFKGFWEPGHEPNQIEKQICHPSEETKSVHNPKDKRLFHHQVSWMVRGFLSSRFGKATTINCTLLSQSFSAVETDS